MAYSKGKVLLTDEEYDALKRELKQQDSFVTLAVQCFFCNHKFVCIYVIFGFNCMSQMGTQKPKGLPSISGCTAGSSVLIENDLSS